MNYLLINTSTKICYVSIINDNQRFDYEWEADRELAKYLLKFLKEKLTVNHLDFKDLNGLGVYAGPGSFTGLRISMTVFNTLADSLKIPIVGVDNLTAQWQEALITKLEAGEDEKIIMPIYGAQAHITKQKK